MKSRIYRDAKPPHRGEHALLAVAGVCILLCAVVGLSLFGLGSHPAAQEESSLPGEDLESSSLEEEEEEDRSLRAEAQLVYSQPESQAAESSWQESEILEDSGPLSPEEAQQALEDLRDVFPEGAYWNHMGLEEWDEFTVTDTPCDHDVYGETYCNTWSGGLQEYFPQYTPMCQCLGFSALLSDLVFGEDAPVTVHTDYTALLPGDSVRLEYTEHSFTVLSVEADGITVVECNKDYEHCLISWDRFLSWEDLAYYSYEMTIYSRYETY